MRAREYVVENKYIHEVIFEKSDLKIIVEGWELGEPDPAFCECEDEGYEGDYFYDRFDSFSEAAKKYVELLEKGWKTVRLSISQRNFNELNDSGVDFLFNAYNDDAGQHDWISMRVNKSKFSEDCAKKLIEIQKIIERS